MEFYSSLTCKKRKLIFIMNKIFKQMNELSYDVVLQHIKYLWFYNFIRKDPASKYR